MVAPWLPATSSSLHRIMGIDLVLHAFVGEDDRFGFGAFRARAAACQINGAAKNFRALVGEHALRVHEARGFLTAVAQ